MKAQQQQQIGGLRKTGIFLCCIVEKRYVYGVEINYS